MEQRADWMSRASLDLLTGPEPDPLVLPEDKRRTVPSVGGQEEPSAPALMDAVCLHLDLWARGSGTKAGLSWDAWVTFRLFDLRGCL